MHRSPWSFILLGAALVLAACGDTASSPSRAPELATPAPGALASLSTCVADPAAVTANLTNLGFLSREAGGNALAIWSGIQVKLGNGDQAGAQDDALVLTQLLLDARTAGTLVTTDAALAGVLNEVFCFVGLEPIVGDPNNVWIIPVNNEPTTLVTKDKLSGTEFPADAVSRNTIVTARQRPVSALETPLDAYPFVYDWSVQPQQTLLAPVIVGVCPSAASLANVPADQLQALLDRLVLGHQEDDGRFEVLARVALPPGMDLDCGDADGAPVATSLLDRVTDLVARLVLPAEVHAARLLRVGGVGGSASEFSSFGPVDSKLRLTGGVGGSASEFSRADALLVAAVEEPAISGTVGTQRSDAMLPSITLTTVNGTPIVGAGVTFVTSAPATMTPVGNASVCGSTAQTDAQGTARVTCIAFGTTTQFRTAYTKLSPDITLPTGLDAVDAAGNPVMQVTPEQANWLIGSYGPAVLAFTAPPAGRTVANNAAYGAGAVIPTTVEIRSTLGVKVPIATDAVTLTLSQGSFAGGATSIVQAAVAGVATFAPAVGTAATGYTFGAAATLGGSPASGTSAVFDVAAGAAANIEAVGTTAYGTVTQALVTPAPAVRVTDGFGNPTPGAVVYWQPGGSAAALANGVPGQSTTSSEANGQTSATWQLGEGVNQLRASLQAASGGPAVQFTATLASSLSTINACAPGGAKDDITQYYFAIPGPGGSNGLVRSIGLYLSAAGAVGQTDPDIGVPLRLVATRTWRDASNVQRTETFTSSANAFLRGDNGEPRLVTFGFDIPPVSSLRNGAGTPQLVVRFDVPPGGYARKINFNVGPCSPGNRCTPPPGCHATEYELPITANPRVYRRSVAILVTGR